MMKKTDLQNFLESRPALSKSAFAREAGISYQMIDYIISGKRNLTKKTSDKLIPIMKKYGWSKEN